MTEHITTPVKRFIKALRKFDPNCPVDDRGDEYYTRCPVHGGTDHDSMSFCEGEHGQLLVHCHSQGCSFDEIMHAVGLKPRHGFTQGSWKSCDDKPNIVRQRRKRLGISPSASKRPASPGKEANVVPPKIGVPVYYDYTDRRGVIVGRVVKIPLTDSNGQQVKKEIYQQRRVKDRFANTLKAGWFKPRGANLYEWVAGPSESEPSPDSILESERARFPIYRLPETLEEVKMGETIFVVEGEKDVDTARALGLCATTNPGGAGKWRKDHSESLQGASQVVFIPDNDEAGFDHVDAVARSLSSIVDEIRIVELPDLDDKQDLTDWVDQGGDVIQLIDLVDAARPFEEHANDEYQIIDAVPERLKRPLAIVNGRSYLFSRVPVGNSVGTTHAEVVVDEDDTVYGSVPMTGARKLGDLPFEIDMPCDINPSRFISPMGLRKLAAGEEVDPGEVFERIVESVKAFIDLDRSIASETTMARLVALMVMQTYFLGAFAKIGYGWIQGPIGSGKSSLLQFMTKIAYLGQFLTASSTHASLRDLAAAGAVLGIDDCNSLTDPRLRPEIHSLLLSGNSRGAMTTLKVAKGNNGWQTVWIPAFGFRFFTATVAPDPVLASRSIQIPLVPTNDFKKAGRDPETMDDWPHDPKTISDDLWILGVRHLTAVEFAYSRTISSALLGRAFDPWRPLLAVATYLDVACPNQYQGLFDEIHDLAVNYQESRQDFAVDDPPRILVKALWSLRPPNSGTETTYSCSPSDISRRMNEIAKDEGIESSEAGEDYTSANKVGGLLSFYRFPHGQRSNRSKKRVVGCDHVLRLADAFGVTLPEDPRGEDATSGITEAIQVEKNWKVRSNSVPKCRPCPTKKQGGRNPVVPKTPGKAPHDYKGANSPSLPYKLNRNMKAPENEISDQSCDNGTLGTLGTGSKPRRNLPGKIVQMVHDARNLSMDKKIAEDISHLNEPSKEGE